MHHTGEIGGAFGGGFGIEVAADIFDLFDDDKTGTINLNNLKRVAKELGETMTVDELKEMLSRAASNNDEITREDFYNIMTKRAF